MLDAGAGGGVTLLRYAPRSPGLATRRPRGCSPPHDLRRPNNQQQQTTAATTNNKEKFLGRLRRRSRSAPRHAKRDQPRPIVYTANGERVRSAAATERPPVQLVGFSGRQESLTQMQQQASPPPAAARLSKSNNRTSSELKEERRLRTGAERSGMTGRWTAAAADAHQLGISSSGGSKIGSSVRELLAERERLLAAQRQLLAAAAAESNQINCDPVGVANNDFFNQVNLFYFIFSLLLQLCI